MLNDQGQELINVLEHIGDSGNVITRPQLIDEAVYEVGANLKVVGQNGVGVDSIDVEAATKWGIKVVTAPESYDDWVVGTPFHSSCK